MIENPCYGCKNEVDLNVAIVTVHPTEPEGQEVTWHPWCAPSGIRVIDTNLTLKDEPGADWYDREIAADDITEETQTTKLRRQPRAVTNPLTKLDKQ